MNPEDVRVPMRRRAQWVGADDVNMTTTPPLCGRRFTMDVSDVALSQMGARVIEHAIERLGQEVPYRYVVEIQQTVVRLLDDREWARPIIEEELRRGVRAYVKDLFEGDK